ncbi:DUF4382 domain-containing protein [Halothermothrix orenii]|uniref:DUF4382 domain-containing protein n=1 Tax=Halothermothrix orenii (strain H 168 / OCM 544 / DSM 9562) TaxID=373903 RepID=B8CY53_HALOH|nr:DUF4382 domain-containing protein [Halothermothrix orenii]ACL70222.1 hypothetical protein Hore_14730 [Halothermothrix orenii H 168]
MSFKRVLLTLLTLTMILGLTACDNLSFFGKETGEIQLLLTDAPADNVEKLLVTISRIETHNDEEGWFTILEEEKEFDLLELQGVSELIGKDYLPEGHYTQMRVYVSKARVQESGKDSTEPVDIPSADQTGIKLVNSFTVSPDKVTVLLLDFDARKSLIYPNNKYKLKPTIRIIEKVISGDIQGKVVDSNGNGIAEAAITVYHNDEFTEEGYVTSTNSGNEGGFKLLGLVEGTYDLEITADNYDESTIIEDVQVTAGEVTTLGEIELTSNQTQTN